MNKEDKAMNEKEYTETIEVDGEFIVDQINKKRKIRAIKSLLMSIYSTTMIVLYLVLSLFTGLWHPLWVLFLTIPIYGSLVSSILRKNASIFSIETLAIATFITVGLITKVWHPTWAILLVIPLYRTTLSSIERIKKIRNEDY